MIKISDEKLPLLHIYPARTYSEQKLRKGLRGIIATLLGVIILIMLAFRNML
jgi:hypothetical protein